MALDNILDNTESTELIIDGPIRSFLAETAHWAKFLSIVVFVMFGLAALGIIVSGSIIMSAFSEFGAFGGFGILFYLIFLGIFVIPIVNLYRFATNTQLALASDNQLALQDAFRHQKSMYKFSGIFMIIILGLYGFTIVGALLFGFMA